MYARNIVRAAQKCPKHLGRRNAQRLAAENSPSEIETLVQERGHVAQKALPSVPAGIDPKRFKGMTGAQIFHEMMLEHDVKHVFGYPGGAILPVFDAIYNSEHFDFILPRHEQGAGHMAEGYARACGKPGVVLVTSGPGATNTVTPLTDALLDGTPLIVFSGQVPTSAMGTDAFQEADVVGITRSCTKWNVLVKETKDLPRRINEAFHIATSGRPGPVLVDLPKDVTAGICNEVPDLTPCLPSSMVPKRQVKHTEELLTEEDWAQLAEYVNKAERPVIYAGQGVIQSNSYKILRHFAKAANIPVTTTLQGLGAFDETDDLSLHMLGMHGSAYANYAIQKADVILAIGARFDDRVTGNIKLFAPEAHKAALEGRGGIVHFEISPKNVNKTINAHKYVLGDVGDIMVKLMPYMEHNPRHNWLDTIKKWKADHPFSYTPARKGGAIKPQAVIEELYRQTAHMSDKVTITTGVGQHQMWAAQYYRWRHPRSWISSGGLGTMGYGVPAAIGAKVARPDHIVVDIDGDASFCMTAMEMVTAAQYRISSMRSGIPRLR
eukprot:Colp12_sorted_trinity150504_noHs@17585